MTETLPTTSSSGLPGPAPPPRINGEDAAAYDDLATRIRAVLQPRDIFEELWARDVADLAWEVLRLRRLKAHLMRACAYEGMMEVLDPLAPCLAGESDDAEDVPSSEELAEQWQARDAEAA